MKNDNKSMVFFFDWLDLFEELDDAEIGQIIKAIAVYAQTGEEPEFADRSIRIVFKSMKNSIDLCDERKESVANARREAANKRWNNVEAEAVAEEDDAKNANAQFVQNENANDAYNTIHNNTINNNTIQNNKEQKKKKQVVDIHTAFGMVDEKNYPPDLDNAVKGWLTYKQQRKEGYVEEGLKSLLTQITNNAKKSGSEVVVDLIRECMGNGYKGIIWDKLQEQKNTGTWNNKQNKSIAEQVSQFYLIGGDRDPWKESQNNSL